MWFVVVADLVAVLAWLCFTVQIFVKLYAECSDGTGVLAFMFHFRPFAVKHFSLGMLLDFGFCV